MGAAESCAISHPPGYADRVAAALASGTDTWGDALIASPGGPTYEGGAAHLAPLGKFHDPGGRSPTTDMHYIPLGQPDLTSATSTTNPFGSPVPPTETWTGARGDEVFGSCQSRSRPATLDAGLPVLTTSYRDDQGVQYQQESFAARVPEIAQANGTGNLVSFLMLTATRAASPVTRVKVDFALGNPGLRVGPSNRLIDDNDRGSPGEVDVVFSPGGSYSSPTLSYSLDLNSGQPQTVYLVRLNQPTSSVDADLTADAGRHEAARASVKAYWTNLLAQGASFSVPDPHVMDAQRGLLTQSLLLGLNYSVANSYAGIPFVPEDVWPLTTLGAFGFDTYEEIGLEKLRDYTQQDLVWGPGPDRASRASFGASRWRRRPSGTGGPGTPPPSTGTSRRCSASGPASSDSRWRRTTASCRRSSGRGTSVAGAAPSRTTGPRVEGADGRRPGLEVDRRRRRPGRHLRAGGRPAGPEHRRGRGAGADDAARRVGVRASLPPQQRRLPGSLRALDHRHRAGRVLEPRHARRLRLRADRPRERTGCRHPPVPRHPRVTAARHAPVRPARHQHHRRRRQRLPLEHRPLPRRQRPGRPAGAHPVRAPRRRSDTGDVQLGGGKHDRTGRRRALPGDDQVAERHDHRGRPRDAAPDARPHHDRPTGSPPRRRPRRSPSGVRNARLLAGQRQGDQRREGPHRLRPGVVLAEGRVGRAGERHGRRAALAGGRAPGAAGAAAAGRADDRGDGERRPSPGLQPGDGDGRPARPQRPPQPDDDVRSGAPGRRAPRPGVSATAGDGQAWVSWSPPASNGGSPVTSYTVTASTGGTCTTTIALSCTVPDLANGTRHLHRDGGQPGRPRPAVDRTDPAVRLVPPAAPAAPPRVAAAGNGQVTVTWSASASDGGSPVTGYAVHASPGGQTCATAGAVTCTVSGLTDGTVYTFAVVATNAVGPGAASAPSSAVMPVAGGYRFVAADGGIFSFGGSGFFGSTGGTALHSPIVGMAETPTRNGYWLVAADGGIFTFGDAVFRGSTGGSPLVRPIVGMEATPTGKGYWLVGADGAIFAFGDAENHGTTVHATLREPIVGMERTATGHGYWLVAADGGMFAFGDAAFSGSMGGTALARPIVGMERTASGRGYWLVASDGGVFAFGDASFEGSMGSTALDQPIVGMARTPSGKGYWLVASDGGVFALGDATFAGSTGGTALLRPIVGMAG